MRGPRVLPLPACGGRGGVGGRGRISCVTDKPPHPTALRAVDLSPRAGRGKERARRDLQPSNSPIRRVERDVGGYLALPAVAVGEQALLVVIELLARLGGEFEVRPLHDGID